jgi:hypothetical protein
MRARKNLRCPGYDTITLVRVGGDEQAIDCGDYVGLSGRPGSMILGSLAVD